MKTVLRTLASLSMESGKAVGFGPHMQRNDGQWKQDQRDGQGRQTWQDGRVYEGQFKNGKFEGFGRMEWHMANGMMVYEGEYVDDLKHGHGRYIWADGRVYDGEWRKGVRSGKATYTNANGQTRQGVWKDDKIERWVAQEPKNPS